MLTWGTHRYDARLLLDSFTLLSLDASTGSQPPSPTLSTWSDFPEDSQETFFLNQEEVEEYDRRKRRRLLDEAYERRRKEREEEEAEVHQGEQDHSQVRKINSYICIFRLTSIYTAQRRSAGTHATDSYPPAICIQPGAARNAYSRQPRGGRTVLLSPRGRTLARYLA